MGEPLEQKNQTMLAFAKRFAFNDKTIIVALAFLVGGLFEPMAFQFTKFNVLLPLYEIDRFICLIGVMIAYLAFGKKDVFCLLVVLFSLSCTVSAYMNDYSVIQGIEPWLPCIIIVLATATAYKNHFKQLLWAAFFVTFSLSCLNLLSMIVYPNGLFSVEGMAQSNYFLFGHRNASYKVFLPALGIAAGLDYSSKRKVPVLTLTTFAISLAQTLLKFSATSLLALVVFAVGIALMNLRSIRKALNGFTYLALYMIAFFGIIVFRLQNIFAGLFTLLGRSMTFTGRTEIWDASLSLLADPTHAAFGYSFQYANLIADVVYARSAHNTILDMLLLAGWAGIALLLVIVLLASYHSYEKRGSKLCSCFSLTFGCLLVIGLMELVCSTWLFMILAFMYYTPAMDESVPDSPFSNDETVLNERASS